MNKLLTYFRTHRKAALGYATAAFGILTALAAHYHWTIWWLPLAGSIISAVGVHAVPNQQPATGQPVSSSPPARPVPPVPPGR